MDNTLNPEQWEEFDVAKMSAACRTFNTCVREVVEHIRENSNNDKKRSVHLIVEFLPDGEVILTTPKVRATLPQSEPIVLETVEGSIHQENLFMRRITQPNWTEE